MMANQINRDLTFKASKIVRQPIAHQLLELSNKEVEGVVGGDLFFEVLKLQVAMTPY